MTDLEGNSVSDSETALQSCRVTALILHCQFLTALATSHLVYICWGISIIDTSRLRKPVESSNTLLTSNTFSLQSFSCLLHWIGDCSCPLSQKPVPAKQVMDVNNRNLSVHCVISPGYPCMVSGCIKNKTHDL